MTSTTLKINKIRAGTQRELAYQEVRKALLLGHLAIGETITVRKLAEGMGLGLSPVREAVQQLATQGALEFLPNKSVRVPKSGPKDIARIFEARILIECFVVEKAAALISEDTVDHLWVLLEKLEKATKDRDAEEGLRVNSDFHFSIYRAADSPYLLRAIERLWLRVGPLHVAPYRADMNRADTFFDVIPLHQNLLNYLRHREAEKAGRQMQEMLTISRDWYLAQSAT